MSDNLEEAGYAAGWITGMFMVGRSIAGIPWGMAADRYGRRICLSLSMLNVFVFGILFGFSFNFYAAAFFRFLLGLGNGFMGISKTYMSEVTKCREHEMRALSYVNGFWGLGMIIGPAIGGMLARPSVQYPKYFPVASIWGQFPYLLPALAGSVFALAAALGIFFCAPETLQSRPTTSGTAYSAVTQKDVEDDIEMVVVQNPLSQADDINSAKTTEEDGDDPSAATTSDPSPKKKALPATFQDILKDKPIQHIFFVYMSYCFICMFYDETFPLFAVSSLGTGGLAWNSAEVGEALAAVGLMLVIFQLFVYEHVMKRFFTSGAKQTLISTMRIVSCTMVSLPLCSDWMLRLLSYFHFSERMGRVLLYLVVVTTISFYKMPSMANFTNISMIVNASVDPAMRGTLNGLMMTAGAMISSLPSSFL
jgi:MFS family permease